MDQSLHLPKPNLFIPDDFSLVSDRTTEGEGGSDHGSSPLREISANTGSSTAGDSSRGVVNDVNDVKIVVGHDEGRKLKNDDQDGQENGGAAVASTGTRSASPTGGHKEGEEGICFFFPIDIDFPCSRFFVRVLTSKFSVIRCV